MLSELRAFLFVVETGSFTGAARRAHLSQPALSAAIQRLEADHGARLFERLPRGARLTAAGEALLPHARATLASVDAGRRAVLELQGLVRGEVRVGGGATACTCLLPPVLRAFRARYPQLRLRVRELLTPRVPGEVAAGALDIGIADGEGEPWVDDPVVLVGQPGATWPGPLVGFVPGASLREAQERLLPEAELVMELGSMAAVRGMALDGMGLALLPRAACVRELAAGELVEIEVPGLPWVRRLGILSREPELLSPAAAAFLEVLWEVAPGASSRGRPVRPPGPRSSASGR